MSRLYLLNPSTAEVAYALIASVNSKCLPVILLFMIIPLIVRYGYHI
jgi:hypothetical protein